MVDFHDTIKTKEIKMNHFIELKDDEDRLVLVNVNEIAYVNDYGARIQIVFTRGAFVRANISYEDLKKILGLKKKSR